MSLRSPSTLAPGICLARRYRLSHPLGEGGMAEVWLARDESSGSPPVAIKVLNDLLAPSARARSRFAIEVEAISRICHPNVIALLGHGTLDDGRPFLVLEYVEGETLEAYLAQRPPLPAYAATMLGGQLLDGIAAAHDQGIVHRDLKPANILLARRPDGKQAKILDFGVARIIDLTIDVGQRLTRTGVMLGSPCYAPAEALRDAKHVDERGDIFAVGAILYHALAGRPPFTATSLQQLQPQTEQQDYPSLLRERPDLAPSLATLIERAMDTDPARRYRSARAMATELERVQV